MQEDLRYEYIQQLCRAIESYTNAQEKEDRKAFFYDGANLKYAVERSLYFSWFKNERGYHLFEQWRQDELPESIEFDTISERDFIFYLFERQIELKRLVVREDRIRSLLQTVKDKLYHLALNLKPKPKPKPKPDTVLVYIEHEKFVRFLEPITKDDRLSFTYVTPHIHVNQFFEKNQLPSIEIDTSLFFAFREQPSKYFRINFGIIYLYNYFYTIVKQVQPKCLIVLEGNHIQDEVINQVGKQCNIPVICFQQGWSPIVHNGFRNMSYSKMLVWGEGFAEILQPYNPQQNFVVTGSHILKSAESLSRQPQQKEAISFFLQSPGELGSKKSWNQMLDLAILTAKEFSEISVLVREHPQFPLPLEDKTKLSQFSNLKLVPSSQYPLAQVLEMSCLMVAIYSTTILEAIALGVLPLIFNVTSLPAYFPDVCRAGAGIEVKSLAEAQETIRKIVTEADYTAKYQPSMEAFIKKYFSINGSQKAVEKIIAEILDVEG